MPTPRDSPLATPTSASEEERAAGLSPSPRSLVLACEMIDDEVLLALEAANGRGFSPPRIWMPAGQHERPDGMRAYLQEVLDLLDAGNESGEGATLPSIRPGAGDADARIETVEVPPADQVLLAIGYCGNGIMGLTSRTASLVFPRVDDCISLMLNGGCTREEIERDAHAFYLTRGWLNHDNPMIDSYRRWIDQFGTEKADRFRKLVLAGYERITLLDTGAYDLDATLPDSEQLADELQLDHAVVPGSVSLLERLFLGPWNSEIVRVPPGEAISIWHLLRAA